MSRLDPDKIIQQPVFFPALSSRPPAALLSRPALQDRAPVQRVADVVRGQRDGQRDAGPRQDVVEEVLVDAGRELVVHYAYREPQVPGVAVGGDLQPDLVW